MWIKSDFASLLLKTIILITLVLFINLTFEILIWNPYFLTDYKFFAIENTMKEKQCQKSSKLKSPKDRLEKGLIIFQVMSFIKNF